MWGTQEVKYPWLSHGCYSSKNMPDIEKCKNVKMSASSGKQWLRMEFDDIMKGWGIMGVACLHPQLTWRQQKYSEKRFKVTWRWASFLPRFLTFKPIFPSKLQRQATNDVHVSLNTITDWLNRIYNIGVVVMLMFSYQCCHWKVFLFVVFN